MGVTTQQVGQFTGLLAVSEGLGEIQPRSEYLHPPSDHLAVIVSHAAG